MTQSMTGYGKVSETFQNKKITIEVKSLNSKSLDLSVKINNIYREKEIEIRNIIAKMVDRGKVDFSLYIEKDEETTKALPVNEEVISEYYKQLKEMIERQGIPAPADWVSTLLRLPDAFSKTESANTEIGEEEWNFIFSMTEKATNELIKFRQQEGISLSNTLTEKINNISGLLKGIDIYEQERVEKIKERITEALSNISGGEYDKFRLEQELIYYIEKLDVNEEKQRLTNHLNYFISTMNEEGAVGKKLGFIAQEIGREINTLGSKSNNADMQKIVVQMKDELEQIKEQVLNTL